MTCTIFNAYSKCTCRKNSGKNTLVVEKSQILMTKNVQKEEYPENCFALQEIVPSFPKAVRIMTQEKEGKRGKQSTDTLRNENSEIQKRADLKGISTLNRIF